MKSIAKAFACLIMATITSACATSEIKPQDDPIVLQLTGKSVDFVTKRLGLPNRRKDLATGAMIWTYFDNEKGLSKKSCSVSISIRNGIIERVYVTRENQSLVSVVTSACPRIRESLEG